MAPPKNNIVVSVVVSGQSTSVSVNINQKVEHLIREALKESGNQGQPPEDWELRSSDGALYEPGATIEAVSIVDGATVYLNPKAGAGGE